MVKLFYTTFISVDLAHQVIFHAKVGKGGIMCDITVKSIASSSLSYQTNSLCVNKLHKLS